jgi:hypothetical protein
MHTGVGTVARIDGMAFSGNRREMGSNKRTTMVAPTLMAMAFLVKAETYASAVAVLASAADCYATPLGFRERSRVSAVIRGIRCAV